MITVRFDLSGIPCVSVCLCVCVGMFVAVFHTCSAIMLTL